MPLSGREKATIFLSMLGPEASARILRFLPGELADLIAGGVKRLPTPSPEALVLVLDEFNRFLALPPSHETYPPPIEVKEEVKEYPPLELLRRSSPKKLSLALAHERPQIIAFVLSNLPPAQAADVLAFLHEYRREVEGLLRRVRKIPLSEKIKGQILDRLAKRLELKEL